MKRLLIIIAVVWFIVLSLIPRSTEVLNKNPIFLLDQGRDYLAVKDIVVNRNLTLIGSELGGGMAGFQGVFHGPFHFYFLGIPFILFNGDPYGGILLMFVFGLLTIGMGFILGKKVFGIYGGLLLAVLIALSPPIIAQSRFVWNPHPASLFILLAFYFIYLVWQKKNWHVFLAAFFSGFIYNFDTAIAVPLSLTLLFYSILLFKRKHFKKYFYLLVGFVISYLPFILFEFRHGFQAVKGFFFYLYSAQAANLRFDSFAFLHNFSDTFAKQTIFPTSLILIIFIVGFIIFILKERKAQIKAFVLFLTFLVVITIAVMSFIKTHIFEYYLIHLNFVYMFIFTYLVFASFLKRRIIFQTMLVILLATFIVLGTVNGVKVMKQDLNDYGGMAKLRGKLDAIDYIYQNAQGQKFGLLIFAPPVYTYPYDYLVWWQGTNKYNYLPHQEKNGLVYLLIERDYSKPWTYEGWLETVIKNGQVLETVELPSGFIVQKRMF